MPSLEGQSPRGPKPPPRGPEPTKGQSLDGHLAGNSRCRQSLSMQNASTQCSMVSYLKKKIKIKI